MFVKCGVQNTFRRFDLVGPRCGVRKFVPPSLSLLLDMAQVLDCEEDGSEKVGISGTMRRGADIFGSFCLGIFVTKLMHQTTF